MPTRKSYKNLLGNITGKARKKAFEGWAKFSQFSKTLKNNIFINRCSLGNSVDDPLTMTDHVKLPSHDGHGEKKSLISFSHIFDDDHEEPGLLHSEDDGSGQEGDPNRTKIMRFLNNYENKLAGLVLWTGHAIIGAIPTVLCATDHLHVVVSIFITIAFMAGTFIQFIYSQGLKFCHESGIQVWTSKVIR